MKKGDRFLPLLLQENGAFSAPVAGIYKLNSDLKGSIIFCVSQRTTGVSESIQARFLVRSYLILLSSGIDTAFWYKFLAEEHSPDNLGGHFGIVHRDLSPREAFTAYKFLTRMLPPGSSRPILKQTGCVHSVSWTRPDRKKIHAIWTTGDVQSFPISFQVQKAYGHLGEEKSFSGTSITATDAPFYLIER